MVAVCSTRPAMMLRQNLRPIAPVNVPASGKLCKVFHQRSQHRSPICCASGEELTATPVKRLLSALAAVSPAALALLGTASPSLADEAADEAEAEAVLAAAAAISGNNGDSGLIVNIFFATVVALLAVVTLGVAYLSLSQWMDSNQEKDDRSGVGSRIKGLPLKSNAASAADKAAAQAQDEDLVVPVKGGRTKRDKSKGFGSGVGSGADE